MASRFFKTKLIAATALLLAVALVALLVGSFTTVSARTRLPVSHHTPAISLGERHGLILASDGSLWSWGCDFLGWPVLGLGNRISQTTALRRIGNETNWLSISAGENHNLAIKSDGTLWTWGESVRPSRGGLALIAVPILAAPGNDWKQAAAGGIHSLAIKNDGTLWGWGNNWAGSVGIPDTNGSSVPVQIGTSTNWVKVWGSTLESVGLQSDGSLWYWGDNPNPAFKQDVGNITAPARVNPDTDWSDVGFGVNTMFAIKTNGTLWAWGRQAHAYTGATNPVQNSFPIRVGTNSDWLHISSASGWWCQGLVKNDGSLWLMDASEGLSNGPRHPYKPVQFRRLEFHKDYTAFAAGAVHAAGPGVHGPIAVLLTPDGEVWTSGMLLGDPPTASYRLQLVFVKLAQSFHFKIQPPDPQPVFKDKPWQLSITQ